jgi:Glycosyl transferase 4-like domain
MLAVVSRFKWVHIDYLTALSEHFAIRVAWAGEAGAGAPQVGIREGLHADPIPLARQPGHPVDTAALQQARDRLARMIEEWPPDVVHVMYYHHEDYVPVVRELVGADVPVIFECRDPVTTLTGAPPGSEESEAERAALELSDGQIVVSRALRAYYERTHALDLGDTSLVVPNGFARATIGPPSRRLSEDDGRVHIALVGTADDQPGHGRWYGEIIQRLVATGLVVHSHFWDMPEFGLSLDPYRELAERFDDYHFHPTVPYRGHQELSALLSRYDLMGVFHELDAAEHNESATLAVCLPTKAVSGWLHGAMPVVCYPHYRGVVELVEELDSGFVVETLEDLAGVAADRAAIAAGSERALAQRDRFTNEHNAARVAEFVGSLRERTPAVVRSEPA